MKQSQLFTKTRRDAPKDEVSLNAQLLIRAGFVDKLMAGVYSFLPLGWRVMDKINAIIREEMNAIGGQELFMPALQPKEIWEKTGRWGNFDALYRFQDSEGRDFALGATHEEVIVPLVKSHIQSYKDLPFAAYQIQSKFRMELRSKSGLLRGREFMMKDLYSFHRDEADLDKYYEKAAAAYERVYQRMGLGELTHKTLASGGSFSKYSHEFQTLCEAGEDIIYVCAKCKLSINREIKEEHPVCPECGHGQFEEKKAIEVGNIFKLKDKYSAPFDLSYIDDKGEKKIVIMGCYGMGPSRILGTIAEVFHDEKGLKWPESVAPFRVHLLSLRQDEKAQEIYELLQGAKIEVLFDDRDLSAGGKFSEADLIGIPYRVVVSEKSLSAGGAEVKKRDEAESRIVPFGDLVGSFKE